MQKKSKSPSQLIQEMNNAKRVKLIEDANNKKASVTKAKNLLDEAIENKKSAKTALLDSQNQLKVSKNVATQSEKDTKVAAEKAVKDAEQLVEANEKNVADATSEVEKCSTAFKAATSKYENAKAIASRYVAFTEKEIEEIEGKFGDEVHIPEAITKDADKFVPKPTELGYFHLELDKPIYNKRGKLKSKPFRQIFTQNAYNQFMENAQSLGYTVVMLWNPEIYYSFK